MVVTNVFKNLIAATLVGSTYTAPTYIAFGNDNTTALSTDTSLGNELSRLLYNSRSINDNVFKITGILPTTSLIGSTIVETGLLDSSTGGNMTIRSIVSSIEKTGNFEVEVNYTITFI